MHQPDSILEELHAIREAIANASDDDLRKIAEAARSRQADSGHEVVRLNPKHIEVSKKAS